MLLWVDHNMDFNYLRGRSIFNQPQQSVIPARRPFNFDQPEEPQSQLQPQGQDTSRPSMMDVFNQINNAPVGPSQQKYRDLLESQPNREDFKPGKMQRLASILSGASEGIRHGAATGYKTGTGIMDEPYNEAMDDYKFKADRLGKASDLEEKTRLNNVKTYRDFITDEQNQRESARKAKLDESTISSNNARANNYKNQGWTKTNNASTGVEEYTRINPDTHELETKPIGKMGLTPTEQTSNAIAKEKGIEGIRQPGRMAVAAVRGANAVAAQKAKFEGIKGILEFKRDNPQYKQIVKNGNIVFYNPADPSDEYDTGIDSGKMSEKDKIAAGIQGRKDVKAAPKEAPVDTETTTEIKDGKRIVTKKNKPSATGVKPAPTGFKPGGKWLKTSKGVEYYVEP